MKKQICQKVLSLMLTLSVSVSAIMVSTPAKVKAEEVWPKEQIASHAVTLQNSGTAFGQTYLRVKNQSKATERVTFLQFDYSQYDLEQIDKILLNFYLYGKNLGQVGQLDPNTAHLYWADYDMSNVADTVKYDKVFSTSTATEIGSNIIQIPLVTASNDGDCYSYAVGGAIRANAAAGKTSITFILKADSSDSSKCGFEIYGLSSTDYAPKLTMYPNVSEEYPITLSQGGTKLKSGYSVVATDKYGIISDGADVVFQCSSDGETWSEVTDDTDLTDNSYLLTNATASMYVRASVKNGEYYSNSLLIGSNLSHPLAWNAKPQAIVANTSSSDKLRLTIPGYGNTELVLLDKSEGKSLYMLNALSAIPYYLDEENPTTSYQIYDPDDKNSIAYKINTADFINTNILPERLQNYILTSEWETEAGTTGLEATNDRVTLSKVAILSTTEYNQYSSKIGYSDSSGMVLRTPSTEAKKANGGRIEQASSTGGIQYKYSYEKAYQVRPCFWLSDDFFQAVKVDVANTGNNVLNSISLKDNLTAEKAYSLGYSKTELAMLGMYNGIILDASGISKDSENINVNINTYNTTEQTPMANFYLAKYDNNNRFVSAEKYDGSISNGASKIGFSVGAANVPNDYSFKLFAWDTQMSPYSDVLYDDSFKSIPTIVSGTIPADSEYLKYVGRWDMSNKGEAIGQWVRPYVEFNVDTESLFVNFNSSGSANTFGITINGNYITQISTTKTSYDISSYLLSGLNTVRITNMTNYQPFNFAGITVGNDSRIAEATDKECNMLFIGDSITSDKVSYSYKLPLMTSADATVIARSGMALQDGKGSVVTLNDGSQVQIGMQTQFDVLECVGVGDTVYDHTKDDYDIIVINIGTNDEPTESTKDDFKLAYENFVSKIHSYYPNAAIVAVKPIRMFAKRANDEANHTTSYWRGIAFDEMNAAGAFNIDNVYYCDTTDLDLTYISDGVHPDEAGHIQFSEFLIDFFENNNIMK